MSAKHFGDIGVLLNASPLPYHIDYHTFKRKRSKRNQKYNLFFEITQLGYKLGASVAPARQDGYRQGLSSDFEVARHFRKGACQKSWCCRREPSRAHSSARAITGWVQGPALGPLVGSRGNAPAGVQGSEPLEALEFYLFGCLRRALLGLY